jgi:hypothetical protein
VAQRDFFRYVASGGLLERLAASYPWPREKQEAPAWFYLVADMAMRLHGNHAFHGFPWVVSTGGLLAAFGPTLGTRHVDPETGRLRIECPGFNKKNEYSRSTPCHPDFLRKIASDTPVTSQLAWFNSDVQKIFRQRRFFDKAGLFIGDGSYLFVPDNPKYEGSARMLFDEHNHPVGKEEHARMSPADAYRDAVGLASLPDTVWQPHTRLEQPVEPPVKPHLLEASRAEPLRRREAKRQQTLARQRPWIVTPYAWALRSATATSSASGISPSSRRPTKRWWSTRLSLRS